MVSMWQTFREQMIYLLKGPGSITPSHTSLVPIQVAPSALKTSLIFESHIQEAGGKGFSKNPQMLSSAWDERRMWGDQARVWGGLTLQERKLIMLDIYLNNPWISACIDVIAKRIFSGGYTVEKIDEEAPDNPAHEKQLHEFALRINPDWDFNQLGRALITDKLIFGECYSEMTWKAGQPWQLFKIDCPTMGYKANRYGQIEQFYQEMEWSRERFFYDPKNIIRWWFPHPRASIDPFAPAEKVTDAVLLDKKMTTWMLTFFQKGTKFPFSVEGVGDQDEADRFLQFFRQNFTGEKNAHAPFVTWGNAKLVWNAAQKLDMDFPQGLDRMRTIVFAAFGVPPAAVSIIESGNIGGGTGEDQDKSLIFNACDPVKQAFFEKLNDRIVRRGMGITDYRYGARYAEYRSDESIAKVEDMRLKNGSRTINEIRVEGGKRPYDKDQGGDVPFIWSSKEITPVPRLGDLEDEQRENAALALQAAAAQADLAQTKAKQAKEMPPEPVQNSPQNGKNQAKSGNIPANDEKQSNAKQLVKPAQNQESVEPKTSISPVANNLWVRPDIDPKLAELAVQGVVKITWGDHPGSCDMCANNNGVTVRLGETFPSGHQLAPAHPHCICSMEYTYANGSKSIEKSIYDPNATTDVNDPDVTQKIPVIKRVVRTSDG